MDKFMTIVTHDVRNKNINVESVENCREYVSNYVREWSSTKFCDLEKELRKTRSLIDIKYKIDYDERYLSGYLLGCEDIMENLMKTSDDNQIFLTYTKDELLCKLTRLLYDGSSWSSNKLAKALNISKTTLPRKIKQNKYIEHDYIMVDEMSQYKYYSITPKGKWNYHIYMNKKRQKNYYDEISYCTDNEFVERQNAVFPKHSIDFDSFEIDHSYTRKSYGDTIMIKSEPIKQEFDEDFISILHNKE